MFEPLYKGNQLLIGNKESNKVIVTLWSKKEQVAKRIDSKEYAVMGQLYSGERGIDFLFRNLLANPQIAYIIVTGNDFSHSGIVLKDFFDHGFEKGKTKTTGKEVWKVKSKYEGYVDMDIPESSLSELRDSMVAVWIEDITQLPTLELPMPKSTRPKQVFEKKEEASNQYIGEDSVYVVRGKTVAAVWLKILDLILKFGAETGTHYDSSQKEILNVVSVITDEDFSPSQKKAK